jgi:3'(2'), 5'-bisphosphate nucleotidase
MGIDTTWKETTEKEHNLKIYNEEDFDIEIKGDNSPLTRADIASHGKISEVLRHKFPDMPILSEEGKDIPYEIRRNWINYFCVDPLDGTKEFIKRNGEFTINIAYMKDKSPVIGIIYIPVKDILYFGGKEYRSFRIDEFSVNYRSNNSVAFLKSSARKLPLRKSLNPFTVIGSRSHMNESTQSFIDSMKKKHGDIKILTSGSAIKLCLIAEGSAHIYPRFAPTMEWDTAAGHVIIEGAGGKVLNYKTSKVLEYNKQELKNPWFIAKSSINFF